MHKECKMIAQPKRDHSVASALGDDRHKLLDQLWVGRREIVALLGGEREQESK